MVFGAVKKGVVTVRNNWKKSLAAAIALGFGGRWADGKLKDKVTLREYSAWAKKIGDESISALAKPRRITVLINPLACDGKAKGKFETNALPLLNLAGIEVNLITPTDSTELENIVAVIDKRETDGIFIIGGDGAISRGITGAARNINSVPIGLFPGGKVNVSVSRLIPKADRDVKWFCEAAKAVIAGEVRKLPVLKVEQLGVTENSEDLVVTNTTYALSTLHWGPFRNVETRKWKYWVWGGQKTKFAYLWSALKQSPESCRFDLTFTLPCAGCSRCYVAPKVEVVQKRWWQNILGFKPIPTVKDETVDRSKVINEICGIEQTVPVETNDLIVQNDPLSDVPKMTVAAGTHNIGRLAFVKEGFARGKEMWSNLQLKSPFFTELLECKELSIVALQLPESWRDLSVDGETVTTEKLKITIVPNQIQFFTASPLDVSHI